MLILGLTGNIGCGKSSLSDIFKENNIEIIDADIIARQIFEDKEVLESVFEQFGYEIKNAEGNLNRKALGAIVFNDDKKLIELNNLTHPSIRNKILNRIKDAKNKGEKIVVIDAALIVESQYLEIIDKLLIVTCNMNEQIKRIKERDKCNKEEAISRIKSQMNQSEKVKFADYVIDNSGNLEQLKLKANNFIMYMKENWCE
ncbi:MAG: dephospho-CoA kinase [Romboutsia sp.]|uniref:dephospho-CoA kinase n=1 Tax=Romboutsia sp. TaxID=1965302 RepID=UPI003F314BC9